MSLDTPRVYVGPMPTPPADCLTGAIGWTFISETDPENAGRWRVKGWRIVFPNHVTEVEPATGLAMRDTVLHAI